MVDIISDITKICPNEKTITMGKRYTLRITQNIKKFNLQDVVILMYVENVQNVHWMCKCVQI